MKSVCVYCSASKNVTTDYIKMAYDFGSLLAKEGIRLVYGGSNQGLMKAVADGCIDSKGSTHGITTHHLYSFERAHEGLEVLEVVDDMHTRKLKMFEKSDAVVSLPGGFGTLDETIEVLTWKQIGLHTKPMVLMNFQGFWDPFIDMMDHIIVNKFATEKERTLMHVVTDIKEIVPYLNQTWTES